MNNICELCGLYRMRIRDKMNGEGSLSADIMFVKDVVEEREVRRGRIFDESDEERFRKYLKEIGLSVRDIYITNLVKCRARDNDILSRKDIQCCKQLLDIEINEIKPRLVVLYGSVVAKELLGIDKIEGVKGSIFEKDGYKVIVSNRLNLNYINDNENRYVFERIRVLRNNNYIEEIKKVDWINIRTMKDFYEFYEELERSKVIVYDIEVMGLDWRKDTILGIGIGINDNQYWLSLLNSRYEKKNVNNFTMWNSECYEIIIKKLQDVFSDKERIFIAHNGKFDDKFLNFQLDINSAVTDDTMLLHAVLDENNRHGLKELARVWLQQSDYAIDICKKNEYVNEEIGQYCAIDVRATGELYRKFKYMLDKKTTGRLYNEIVMPIQNVMKYVELCGIKVDRDKLLDIEENITIETERLHKEIMNEVGEDFNINSTVQLSDIIIRKLHCSLDEKTVTGKRKVDEGVLQRLSVKNKTIKKVVEYRKYMKLKRTYVEGMLGNVRDDGRIHTEYGLAFDGEKAQAKGTVTGRISSANPNLQNIPRRDKMFGKEIRNAFIPADGCKFIEFDYSQMELRIMAVCSGDEKLKSAFREGKDIHSITISYILKKDVSQITKEERQLGKGINFGVIYGGHNEYSEDFLNIYADVKKFQNRIADEVRKKGEVVSILGRVRRFPDILKVKVWMRERMIRQAINSMIQGIAADVHSKAVVRVFEMLCKDYVDLRKMRYSRLDEWCSQVPKIVLTVHDSILIEVPIDLVDEVGEKVKIEMIRKIDEIDVPLEVDMKILDCWE